MKSQEEHYSGENSLGFTGSWASLPLMKEVSRSGDWTMARKDDQVAVSQMLENQEIKFALCTVDRILKNPEFELALPVGVVVHGSCSLAYFTSENCDELKQILKPRLESLSEIFKHANLNKNGDMREAARFIWEASRGLVEPRLKHPPYIKFNGGCGLFTSLARVMYRLLFGETAYETNCMIQGSNGTIHHLEGFNLEFRQGNDALSKRCSQRSSIDLVETWCDLTHLPFVSSVIQKSHKAGQAQSRQKLLAYAEMAQAKMKIDPASYLPDIEPLNCNGQKIDLISIWKNISYRLNPEDLKSLLLFLNLARSIQKKSTTDDQVSVKLLRWQQQEASSRLLQ